MLRKILALSLVALLASASFAEAGLCGRGFARRGLFGRRAVAAAPCGQAGYSASYYSQSSCGQSITTTYGTSSITLPAPATYVAPVVTATPQVPAKSLPIPNDRRTPSPF
jgi:hypothetical protein